MTRINLKEKIGPARRWRTSMGRHFAQFFFWRY
jgi:hypothetical protein